MNRLLTIIGIIMTTAILAAFIPGSYGGRALDKAKSLGYIEYPPEGGRAAYSGALLTVPQP